MLPALGVAAVFFLVSVYTGQGRWESSRLLASLLAVCALYGLTLPASVLLTKQATDAVRAYPARVAPLLEAYRTEHGSYPDRLDQLPSAPPLPRLLRERGSGYFVLNRGAVPAYGFKYHKPGSVDFGTFYDSTTAEWRVRL